MILDEFEQFIERFSDMTDEEFRAYLYGAPMTDGREIECVEYVVAYPQPTDEDLAANHAAGLPVTRERLTRCKDCRWAHEAPSVEQWHLECRVRPLSRHYTDANGFCHLGEAR